MNWTLDSAQALCMAVESVVPAFGCHVALTGGVLYKEGERKDCDLVIYRAGLPLPSDTRGDFFSTVDRPRMLEALERVGLTVVREYGRVVKCTMGGVSDVDLIFPECEGCYGLDLAGEKK